MRTEITGKIVEVIESGRHTGTFQMPWKAIASEGLPVNAVTGTAYHGANVLFLSLEAMQHGWPNKWASFQQWKEKGASVKKGVHGVPIVFYKSLLVDEVEEDEDGKNTLSQNQSLFFAIQLFLTFLRLIIRRRIRLRLRSFLIL